MIGDETLNPELLVDVPMVTELEARLVVFPEAVAFAVTTVPDDKLRPVFVQAPPDIVVVVPTEVAPENTSMVVPAASDEEPEIEEITDAVQYVP